MEITKENQPRISLPLLSRLFNSISHKKKSPVCSLNPAILSASSASEKCSSSCRDLIVIDTKELLEIEKRWRGGWGLHLPAWGNAQPCDLSDKGYFLTHDVPKMLAALHNAVVSGAAGIQSTES